MGAGGGGETSEVGDHSAGEQTGGEEPRKESEGKKQCVEETGEKRVMRRSKRLGRGGREGRGVRSER